MPRNYAKKKDRKFSDDILRGTNLVETSGFSVQKVADEVGVLQETLRRWITNPLQMFGSGSSNKVLTDEEEELIAVGLETAAKLGWPCGTTDLKNMVKTFFNSSKRPSVFKDNVPGKDWVIGFKKRWSDRLFQNLNC